MTKLRRVAAGAATLGLLLPLSGCGSSGPSVFGSYRATFVAQILGTPSGYTGKTTVGYTIVLFSGGHFVMTILVHHVPTSGASDPQIKGTWIESRDHLKLKAEAGPVGIRPHKTFFTALVKARTLVEGTVDAPGEKEPPGFMLTWTAVRTG